MSVAVGENWIKIPKCKLIRAKVHREITGKIKSITLSRTPTGKCYASVLAEDDMPEAKPVVDIKESGVIGVDVGLTDTAITSTGVKTGNPRFIKNAQRNLKRKQKKLSRCRKGSKGRGKARLLVAKAHERVAFARNDFQHKLSRQLVDETQAAICVETLKVKNMLKNHCLARSIADAGWHSLITKLDYKAKQEGKYLVKIDQWFASSKTCSCCGHKVDEMPLSVRSWDCPNCKIIGIDRDVNAACNIKKQGILKLKAEGLSVSANGGKRKSSALLGARPRINPHCQSKKLEFKIDQHLIDFGRVLVILNHFKPFLTLYAAFLNLFTSSRRIDPVDTAVAHFFILCAAHTSENSASTFSLPLRLKPRKPEFLI